MPSFDIVSEIDHHELTNTIDQANREIDTRFDFRNTNAKFELKKEEIAVTAPTDFQVKQMREILESKASKRQIDVRSFDFGAIETNLHEARQTVKVKQGIEQAFAKKLMKLIKETGFKGQTSIQGEQVRVTAKKRDDLQAVIAFLKEQKLELPLQFVNFRD